MTEKDFENGYKATGLSFNTFQTEVVGLLQGFGYIQNRPSREQLELLYSRGISVQEAAEQYKNIRLPDQRPGGPPAISPNAQYHYSVEVIGGLTNWALERRLNEMAEKGYRYLHTLSDLSISGGGGNYDIRSTHHHYLIFEKDLKRCENVTTTTTPESEKS